MKRPIANKSTFVFNPEKLGLGAIFLCTLIFSLNLLLNHLNLNQGDALGHFFSANQVRLGFYHLFSDKIFSGYIHGLFYPPLEDFLLAPFTSGEPQTVMRLYLSVLSSGWLITGWMVLRTLNAAGARILWCISFLVLFFLQKNDSLNAQGLALVDLMVTGLTSQVLAGALMLLLIREFLRQKPRWILVATLYALILISHIVIAAATSAFLVCVLAFSHPNRTKTLKVIGSGLVFSAFFWVPLLIYRANIANSNIFYGHFWEFLCLTAVACALTRDPVARSLCLCAALFFSVNELPQHIKSLQLLVPQFHYYRFISIGFLFALLGMVREFEVSATPKFRGRLIGLIIVFVGLLLTKYGFQEFNTRWVSFYKSTVTVPSEFQFGDDPLGRSFVIGENRTADTNLDSYLASTRRDFRSSKGLFWESSKSNSLTSSYLATLLSSPVVLDHYFHDERDCALYSCLLEQYVRSFNLSTIVGSTDAIDYAPAEKAQCLSQILANGTSHFEFNKISQIKTFESNQGVYQIKQKKSSLNRHWLSAVERIDSKSLITRDLKFNSPFAQSLELSYEDCAQKNIPQLRAIIIDSELQNIPVLNTPTELSQPTLEKLGEQRFLLNTHSEIPAYYVIKLAQQPGLEVTPLKSTASNSFRSSGRLVEGYPHIVIYGAGEMTLDFLRPPWTYLGYAVSGFAAIALLISLVRTTRDRRPRP